MASFVPHYRKKQLQLQELEGELMALLQAGAPSVLIAKKADEVRCAQVRAIKERVAKLPQSEKSASAMQKLQTEMAASEAATTNAILAKYRTKVARSKGPVRVVRAPRRGCW